ncbi:hypothetical protein [Oenococcus sicerae]|uniref:Uncharacterized protein n=1 Tax=Oenococcus sicerae TaxID=2203724 RepID=A0AAJ1R9M7_9LACO|nr:hypothetical protein [Oenococcus sicerae]MDN6899563.1 hypothetical protein [Oenococcus sicerae]
MMNKLYYVESIDRWILCLGISGGITAEQSIKLRSSFCKFNHIDPNKLIIVAGEFECVGAQDKSAMLNRFVKARGK